MGRMEDDIRDLQKLSKMDLVMLLEGLDGELEKIESAYHISERRCEELKKTTQELHADNRALLDKNAGLVEQLQVATEKLLRIEENPVDVEALASINQQMVALKEQNEKQGDLLRAVLQANSQRAEESANVVSPTRLVGDRARMLLEDAKKRAAAISNQIQKSNMDMFSEMQESIARAKSRCEAAIEAEQQFGVQTFCCEIERLPSSPPMEVKQQYAEVNSGDQIVLDTEQAQNLLNILKRFKKMRDGVYES